MAMLTNKPMWTGFLRSAKKSIEFYLPLGALLSIWGELIRESAQYDRSTTIEF